MAKEQRKPYSHVRIKSELAEVAKERAGELLQNLNQYVLDAVRMRLESEGKWPITPKVKK